MPSQLLHTLFGEDVIVRTGRLLESRPAAVLQTVLAGGRNVFALGCQGPDIFYHSRRRRPVGLEYGTLLHRRGVGCFSAALLSLALPPPPVQAISAVAAYALGFMTHAFLDRAAHPFIVYKSCRLSPPQPGRLSSAQSHAFFERVIDTLMFKILRGGDIVRWDQEGVLSSVCAAPPPGLEGLLARALTLAFPERAGKDGKLIPRIENTLLDSAAFYRMTAPANVAREIAALQGRKERLVYVYPEKLPEGLDFLNLQKRPWFHPAGGEGEDTRSFPELYTASVEEAAAALAALIGPYLEGGPFPAEEAAAVIGNGGLSITDGEGVPRPPCRADPLPLDEVLEWLAGGGAHHNEASAGVDSKEELTYPVYS